MKVQKGYDELHDGFYGDPVEIGPALVAKFREYWNNGRYWVEIDPAPIKRWIKIFPDKQGISGSVTIRNGIAWFSAGAFTGTIGFINQIAKDLNVKTAYRKQPNGRYSFEGIETEDANPSSRYVSLEWGCYFKLEIN